MAQKNKRNTAGDRLREFIAEALEERENTRKQLPQGLVSIDPGWPYLEGAGIFSAKVSKEIGSPAESKKQLKFRLEKFLYPYPDGNTIGKTFYQHLRGLGLLDVILNPPVLGEIRRLWWFQHYYEEEKTAQKRRKSEHGYPLGFHRKLMFECSFHLQRIQALQVKNAVKKDWTEKYRTAILKQLLNEATICYPELLRWTRPALKIRPHSFHVDRQLELFDAIEAAFRKEKTKNHKLAMQLTTLICSTPQQILTGKLDPSPDTVRRNIRDRKKNSA